MSNFPEYPWSTNPNAPKISERIHLYERSLLLTIGLGATLLGAIIVTFIRCTSALLSPERRNKKGVKWLLAAHTVAMFSFATVSTVTSLYRFVIFAVDDREFPGVTGWSPPGIDGYIHMTSTAPIAVVSNTPLLLNGLLADGLLLYRCHVIYAMNYWVIAFPSLLYISSIGIGIIYIFVESLKQGTYRHGDAFVLIYLAITLSLNILLTVMIVARLVLHNRIIRNAMGSQSTPSRLTNLKFVNALLIESCALYALTSVLYIAFWSVSSYIVNYIIPIFEASQVIGPFLIILRVANRTAVTSDVGCGGVSSIRFGGGEESTQGDGPSVDGTSGNQADGHSNTPGEVGVGDGNDIEEVSR